MTAVLMPITSPGRGHQRPARIAGIERGVGLHHVLDHPAGARLQRAAERRDDARGHRGVEAERVADGDRDLAAPEPGAVAQFGRGQRDVGFDPEQREIGVGIIAEHARLKLAALERGEAHRPRALHDMAVGEGETIGGNDDAGARARAAALLAHVDAHHTRADPLHDVADDARIVVKQSSVIGGGGGAGTLAEIFGIERQSWGGNWGCFDHCGDMVTGGQARKQGRSQPATRRAAAAELASFEQMDQISAKFPARLKAKWL